MKKDRFKWGEDATNAFEALKKAMEKLPMLASPYFNRPFVIKADASGDPTKPIAFYSQHPYLMGRKFFVRTDQKALKYLLEQRLIPDALSRRVESTQLGSLLVPLVLDWKELISTQKQLATDALWCFYNSVLSKVKPKNFKSAVTEDLPPLDCAMIIALKWIYKTLEAIRIFLANAASKNMIVYQMDVKIAFLNGELKEAVYAPRAWYDTLSKFLLAQGFSNGIVDPTLFIRKTGKHTLHVQIYVDDIIFASIDPKDCLQISQNPRGIFINQSKYANEILKKFDLHKSNPVDTPIVERTQLDEDLLGIPVDQTQYRSMIGSLMYLTASRHDLVFAMYTMTDVDVNAPAELAPTMAPTHSQTA
ncbi:retrovirus-related pol polyprotein from transposon TNT 1-94 [Tanacetum coccineum]